MAKYRIKQEGVYYYPQFRFLFTWHCFFDNRSYPEVFYKISDAKRYLDELVSQPEVRIYPYP